MGADYLLGIDVGTFGSKGVLVDVHGRILASAFVEHGEESPRTGWYEQDADAVWWGDLIKITGRLVGTVPGGAGSVAAVGVSAVTPDVLPVDARGNALRRAILYSDTRAASQAKRMVEVLGQDAILATCGNALSVQSAGPRLLWLRENEPDLFWRAHKIMDAPAFLVHRLTGTFCADRSSIGAYHPFMNIRTLEWDEAICAEFGVPVDKLPELRWSTDIVGSVTRAAAAATGLVEGIPVIAGAGDGIAEMVSVGPEHEGEAALLYGTTMVLVTLTRRLRPHPKVITLAGPLPGTYVSGAYMNTSAALSRWFRDNLGQVERRLEAQLGINAYQLLSSDAAEVPPGSAGLVVLPYFAGEGYPILDEQARGLILGLTLTHTRKHVYRALLEGVAYGLRHNWETILSAGVNITRIRAVGGGTKSAVWTQIISDVIGQDQELVASHLGAPYGDAYLAGLGIGMFRDLSTLHEEWVRTIGVVKHRPEIKPVYDSYYAVYKELYPPLADSMHTLARISVEPVNV
ncbi:MAG: Xylulose kinase [Chloroflexi bacterium ADurb.Bin180]|nr:MAG: Xylulose kinase [Chloroflexi bacterium ADurb.Bin180]